MPKTLPASERSESSVAAAAKDGHADIAQKAVQIIAACLHVPEASVLPASRFKEDLGSSTLDNIEIILAIEDEFSLFVPDPIVETFTTVAHLTDWLVSQVGAQ